MRMSDWSSDVCSSDLEPGPRGKAQRKRQRDIDADEHAMVAYAIQHPARSAAGAGGAGDHPVEAVRHQPAERKQQACRSPERVVPVKIGEGRSEARRVGKECVSPGSTRWGPYK